MKEALSITCILYGILFTGCTNHTEEYSEDMKHLIHASCRLQYNKFKNKPLNYKGYMNSSEVDKCTKHFLKNYAPTAIYDDEGKKWGIELRNFY